MGCPLGHPEELRLRGLSSELRWPQTALLDGGFLCAMGGGGGHQPSSCGSRADLTPGI